MNIFDILGPVMVGPSSSHTAGAVRMGYAARSLLGKKPKKVQIGLHGSFAATGEGHGTDRALIAGLLEMKPDDTRIPSSFQIAEKEGMEFCIEKINLPGCHPNTALIKLWDEAGKEVEVQASSIGGGRILIDAINGVEVKCSGELPTLIIHNEDQPGCVSEITAALTNAEINIATMKLCRDRKGGCAVMVLETDQELMKEQLEQLSLLQNVTKVTYINREGM